MAEDEKGQKGLGTGFGLRSSFGVEQEGSSSKFAEEEEDFVSGFYSPSNPPIVPEGVQIKRGDTLSGRDMGSGQVSDGFRVPADDSVTGSVVTPGSKIEEAKQFLSGYSADTVADLPDLLGIERDCKAFARLITAREVAVPIAIGLFGEWGSGKSFFMSKLMDAVTDITNRVQKEKEEKSQKDLSFYSQVVQIQFNAWQYMESDLWASLVAHIFTSLQALNQDQSSNAYTQFQESLKEKLAARMRDQQDATARVQEASRVRERADAAVFEARQEYEQKAKAVEDVTAKDVIEALKEDKRVQADIEILKTKLGSEAVGESAADLLGALGEARSVIERSRSLLGVLSTGPGAWRLALGVLAVLLLPALLALAVAWLLTGDGQSWLAQTSAIITGTASFIGAAAGWLHRQANAVSTSLAPLERSYSRLTARLTEERERLRNELAARDKERELAQEKLNAAERALLEADQRVSEASLNLANATPASVMANFIQERVRSSDYTQRLGLLSLVRQDFKVLSDLIDEQNKKIIEGQSSDETLEFGINRIILYIDDLDRCTEEKVVEVLQAVHLLLALPLFVVIVAVDARWIHRALQSRYPQLLQEPKPGTPRASSASPLDYLEKIFQIPFWLSPISEESRKEMLHKLFAGSVSDADNDSNSPRTGGAAGGTGHDEVDLTLEALSIEKVELDLIEKLTPLLGRSPRALKRFVNIYRLIKAGLNVDEQNAFVPASGAPADFSTVMFLLALVTNSPGIAAACFRALDAIEAPGTESEVPDGGDHDQTPVTIWSALVSQMDQDEKIASTRDWLTVKKWIKTNESTLLTDDRSRIELWAHRVARFSFDAEPTWLS